MTSKFIVVSVECIGLHFRFLLHIDVSMESTSDFPTSNIKTTASTVSQRINTRGLAELSKRNIETCFYLFIYIYTQLKKLRWEVHT